MRRRLYSDDGPQASFGHITIVRGCPDRLPVPRRAAEISSLVGRVDKNWASLVGWVSAARPAIWGLDLGGSRCADPIPSNLTIPVQKFWIQEELERTRGLPLSLLV